MSKFGKKAMLLLLLIGLSTAELSAQIVVRVRPPRPRVVVTARPPAPSPRHVWIDEDWEPAGAEYRWHGGYWAEPPRPHARWVAGSWKHSPHGYVWVAGRWR